MKRISPFFAFQQHRIITFAPLRPLVKYPASMLLLLLIGYSQLFAPLYRGVVYSPLKSIKEPIHGQTIIIKAPETEAIFIEEEEEKEEDERTSFKRYTECSSFFYSHILEYGFEQNKSLSSFCKHVSCFSTSESPYLLFKVFRL